MTKVSILLPTLNRGHLLRAALKSAIEQDFADLEIVVSDDCSDDDTRAVAESTGDARVRYVRTPRRFDMTQSFEFTMQQARGDHLTWLTDDSYLLPGCISSAMREMERHKVDLVVWRHCGYFDHDWLEPQRRNALYIPKTTGAARMLDSRASTARWMKEMRDASAVMPRAINSLCHRSLVERVVKKQGAFFLPPAPDHSSGLAMLVHTERYVLLDEPLVVDGVTKESIGPSQSFNLGKSAQDFYASFGKSMEEITFLGIPTTPAIIARAFENVRAHHPGTPPIDRRKLVAEMVDSIAKLHVYGAKVGHLFDALDVFVRKEAPELRAYSRRARLASTTKWRAVRLVRRSPTLSRLEALRDLKVVRGERAGFTDIEGSARVVERANRERARSRG